MKDSIRLPGGALVLADGTVAFKQPAGWWELKAHTLGDHLEVTAKRPSYYVEGTEDDLTDNQRAYLRRVRRDGVPELTEEEEAERRMRCLVIAGNRRKSAVRKHCKVMGADTMLTLTFRENVTDIQTCKTVLRSFARRIKSVCPGFRGVAVFELQERGAWHVHLATTRHALAVTDERMVHLKSYNVIRAVWRAAAGDLGGNIDVSTRKRSSQRSPAKLASYLSKYLTKNLEDSVSNVNMWTKFGDISLPPPVQLGRVTHGLDMLTIAFDLCGASQVVSSSIYSRFGDWFFLSFEPRSLVPLSSS